MMILTSCAALGLEQPTSFQDRVAYAYSNIDGAVRTATNALNAKAISSAEAKYIRDTAMSTRTIIVGAETVFGEGDIKSAEGRLALAENVLRELQAYTAKRVKS
jgi:hypothetical protein